MWNYTYTDELYHYGVPGMKWGKRKAQLRASIKRGKELKKMLAKEDDRLYQETLAKEENYYKKISQKHGADALHNPKIRRNAQSAVARIWKQNYHNDAKRTQLSDTQLKDLDNYKQNKAKKIVLGVIATSLGTTAVTGALLVSGFKNAK